MRHTRQTSTAPSGVAVLDAPHPAEGRIGTPEDKSDFHEARHQVDRIRRNQSTLQLGSKGEEVKFLQQDLNSWLDKQGLARLDVNGNFDRRTLDAVREFQRYHAIGVTDGGLVRHDGSRSDFGLIADGIVGPRTMRALDLENGRESLAFAEFKAVTGGWWDKSQVSPRFHWLVADGTLSSTELRQALMVVHGPNAVKDVDELLAKPLGANVDDFIRTMYFETGGTFSTREWNRAGSGARGVFQCMPATARGFNTTIEEVENMPFRDQLRLAKKHFSYYQRDLTDPVNVYLANFYPRALRISDPNEIIFRRGTRGYRQNSVFDPDHVGYITKASIARVFMERTGLKSEDPLEIEMVA